MSSGPLTIETIDSRVRVLEARSTETLDVVKSIQQDMRAANAEIRATGKVQWPVLLGAATLCVALIGFIGASWKAPLDSAVIRLEGDVRGLQSSIVPRAEHSERYQQQDAMLAAMRDRVTRDMQTERATVVEAERRINERLDRLESRVLFGGTTGKRTELTTRTTP